MDEEDLEEQCGPDPEYLFELEDAELFSDLLEQQYGRKPKLHVPQRGDNVRLIELACKNAQELIKSRGYTIRHR